MYDNDIRVADKISYPPSGIQNIIMEEPSVHRGHAENSHPVEYSYDLARVIHNWLVAAWQQHWPYNFHPPLDLPIHVQDEMYRFSLALKAYEESYKPLLTINYLIDLIFKGEEAIKWLKNLRRIHCVLSHEGWFDVLDPDLNDVVAFSKTLPPMEDLGQIFNVRYWFFWDQSDSHDWEACFIPLPSIEQDHLKELEERVFDLLPDAIEAIEEEEILLSVSGSSTRTKQGKTSKVFVEKQKNNCFSSEPLVGYGSYIQKCPGDTRFSITLSVPQSNSVKLIEKQCALIAEEMPFSAYVKDNDDFDSRYESFKKSSDWFYCRDLKKDGLTKVRPAIQAVCRAISRKYPALPCNKYFSIYNDLFIYIDDVMHNPPRGTGLGMCSALTTILQSAMFSLTRDLMYEEYQSSGMANAIFYNDDAALGFDCQDTAEDYIMAEDTMFGRFGFICSKTKSFMAKYFVLCENYSDRTLDTKDSYQRYLLELPLTAVNVSHAKFLFAQNLRSISTVDWTSYISKYVERFGREYYFLEERNAAQLGGWVPAVYMNVDIALNRHEGDFNKRETSAALAYTMARPPSKKRLTRYTDERYHSPTEQIYGSDLVLPEKKPYFFNMSEKEVAVSFLTYKEQGAISGFWDFILMERRRRYNDLYQGPLLMLDEFYREYCKVHPLMDILPPQKLFREGVDIFDYPLCTKIYKPANSYLSYIKWFNPHRVKAHVIPWPVPPNKARVRPKRTSDADRALSSYTLPYLDHVHDLSMELVIQPLRAIPSTQWFDPNSVRNACVALGYGDIIPFGVERNELAYFKEIPQLTYTAVCDADKVKLMEWIARRCGSSTAITIVQHASTFIDDLMDEPYYKRALLIQRMQILAKVEESLNAKSEDSVDIKPEDYVGLDTTPLRDDSYWEWTLSDRNYVDWRNEYFHRIDSALEHVQCILLDTTGTGGEASFGGPRKIEYTEECVLDTVSAYLYVKSGGIVDDNNIPVINRGSASFFDEGGGASNEPDGDVFDDDSFEGLGMGFD